MYATASMNYGQTSDLPPEAQPCLTIPSPRVFHRKLVVNQKPHATSTTT